jgi:hypothetical protein
MSYADDCLFQRAREMPFDFETRRPMEFDTLSRCALRIQPLAAAMTER